MLFLLVVIIAGAAIVVVRRSATPEVELPPDVDVPDFVGTRETPSNVNVQPEVPPERKPPVARPSSPPPVRVESPPRPPARGTVTSMSQLLRKLSEIRGKGYNSETHGKLVELGRELAREDFDNAIQLMKAVSDSGGRTALCQGIFEYQATVNPQAAIAEAMKLNPGDAKTGRFLANYSRDKRVFDTAITSALKGWAQTSPQNAAAYINQLPESNRHAAAIAVYGMWGQSDPASALRMASALPEVTQRSVLPQICRSWAETNPQAAWSYVVQQDTGLINNRTDLLADIASRWTAADLNSALSWMDTSIQDDKLYTEIMQKTTRKLSGQNPETAATLLGIVPGLYELQPHLLSASMHAWVRKDPSAAAAWAAGVELDAVRSMAIKTVSSFWAGEDFDKAFTWATSLNDSMSRAYALSNVALRQGKTSPDKSTDWIYSIGNEFEQARTIAGYVLGRVSRSKDGAASRDLRNLIMSDTIDFNAIQDSLLKSKLSDEEKQQLLDMLP